MSTLVRITPEIIRQTQERRDAKRREAERVKFTQYRAFLEDAAQDAYDHLVVRCHATTGFTFKELGGSDNATHIHRDLEGLGYKVERHAAGLTVSLPATPRTDSEQLKLQKEALRSRLKACLGNLTLTELETMWEFMASGGAR